MTDIMTHKKDKHKRKKNSRTASSKGGGITSSLSESKKRNPIISYLPLEHNNKLHHVHHPQGGSSIFGALILTNLNRF